MDAFFELYPPTPALCAPQTVAQTISRARYAMPTPFMPAASESLYTWVNRLQNRYKYRDNGLDMNLLRLITAYYYATISFVDYQIGRILQTLAQTNHTPSTTLPCGKKMRNRRLAL